MELDDRFIDVDFESDPNFVFGDLGAATFGSYPSYEEMFGTLSDAEIDAAIEAMDAEGGGGERLVTRIYNQGQEGSCFPSGTLVTMGSGEVRPIEDVKCLDSVVTAEGNVGQVRQTMARPYIGQLVGVHLYGHNLVRCTPEHPILTKRGYVSAESLTADDFVAIPKVRPATVSVIQTSGYLPTSHRCLNELRIKKFNAPRGRTFTQVQIAPLPDILELDVRLGRIIGLFLAEGNTDKQKIVWTFNVNEIDTLVSELQKLLRDRLGVDSKIRIAGSRSTAKVQVYGSLWARFFEGLCSSGSGQKRLCPELASGPPEFLRAVFEGWMSGDGNRQQRRNTGVTVSRRLAVQMFQIATRLGMQPALRRSEPKPNSSAASRLPRYDLTFSDANTDNCWRRDQDESHCWRKMRMLTRENFSGHVYNIHVHGDESYVADGLGVHNCVANATSQAHEVVQALQHGKANVVHLSAISLYKRIGRSAQSGAMVSDGLKEMASRGILPLDTPENRAKFGDAVMPNTGFSKPYPDNWQETAALFRGLEYHTVNSVAGLLTALCNQHPVVVGRQGHSICYLRPMRRSGRRVVAYANSWGGGANGWGAPMGDHPTGFGFDTESQIRQSASWAFVLRAVTIPPGAV